MLLIIIDGIADIGTPQTNFQTPLQMAKIPLMNAIASTGICGLMDPVEPGLSCGSDTAHMSIFGYDPFTYYRGRGAFETMGSAIEMNVGDIAFKCNFAHMKDGIVKLRRVDREFPEWGLPLIDAINEMPFDYPIEAKHATEHRIGLKVSGLETDQIIGTDPLKDNLPLRKCKPKIPLAEHTAQTIDRLSNSISEMLQKHPINVQRELEGQPTANIVLLRGCGQRIDVPSFKQMHGLTSGIIAPTAIIQGIGKTLQMEYIPVVGATGDYNSNFINKGKAALEALNRLDFVFLHIKAVDDAGHDKSLELKIKYLELADEMINYIVHNSTNENLKICVTGDHTTPVSIGDHTYQPVPVAISRLKLIKSNLKQGLNFNEIDCLEGELGRFCGKHLIPILKDY